MNFNLIEAIEILERTPKTLEHFLSGLSDGWLECTEGEGTWNAVEIIDHLIEGEKVNWIPRLKMILNDEGKPFPPFDRYAHLNESNVTTIEQKLVEYKSLRAENIHILKKLIEDEETLEKKGTHPVFGSVKARELISTWAVHDLTHITQIVRVMAGRYKADVGPWIEFLGILKK